MGFLAAGASMVSGMAGSAMRAHGQSQSAAAEARTAETSRILEAAFFDDEVEGIIAESARLVGAAEAEAGARGVKSTTGTAAARTAEIRRAGVRELRTAAQKTVLTRHRFAQAGRSAARAGSAAALQGGLAITGTAISGMAKMSKIGTL